MGKRQRLAYFTKRKKKGVALCENKWFHKAIDRRGGNS